MGHVEMKMEMIQCLMTGGYNETHDDLEAKYLDESDPEGLIELIDE